MPARIGVLSSGVANRSREAAEWARGEKARREAERDRKNRKGR